MRLKKIKLINRILSAENDLKFICEGLIFLKNTKKISGNTENRFLDKRRKQKKHFRAI